MPEINGDKEVTHYFIPVSPNCVIEYGRGFVATRPIFHGEPLALATTKGVPVDEFIRAVGVFREIAKCDIESRDTYKTSVKATKQYATYIKTTIEPPCSTRKI